MPASYQSWTRSLVVYLLGMSLLVPAGPSSAEAADDPVTAKITLGPHEGMANPSKAGHAKTGGGDIQVTQPTPDTLVVRMSGSAAAMGNCFVAGNALFDFLEELQFSVEFSQPGHMGQLILQSKVNGLLVSHGKDSSAGMPGAMATVFSGPQEIASLVLPERMICGSESVAVNLSQGPICVPIQSGCYGLRQQFRIMASQAKGCGLGGRATAEFSPSALPTVWQGTCYPFEQVDKQNLGFTVTLQVVPSTDAASVGVAAMGGSAPAPPTIPAAIAPALYR